MKALKVFMRVGLLLLFLLLLFSTGHQQVQASEQTNVRGVLTIIWADTPTLQGKPPIIRLNTANGDRIVIDIPPEVAARLGGVLKLNNRQVTVQGRWTEGIGAQAGQSILLADEITLQDNDQIEAQNISATALTGSQPWVNILCKFNDIATEPKIKSYFDNLFGNAFPGLNHYWSEVSYNNINISGTSTYGWFQLPRTRSYYISLGNGMLDALANDCTAVADSQVYYPPFVGINLIFNSDLDGYAWGGTNWMTLDGVSRIWRMTWEPPWGYQHQHVLAHEMGHGWGWPHSSGPYNNTYDSQWDVMSSWPPSWHEHSTYGDLGIHTISYHKDLSGWIPAERIYVAAIGSSRILTLDRLSEIPAATNTYLMVKIPIPDTSGLFYTVEVRQRKDSTYLNEYEDGLPGQAVIIHKVDPNRADRNAQIVDSSLNNDPNDAGAMWLPGETFTDTAKNISVQVLSATTNGYSVRIANGAAANDNFSAATIITKTPYSRYQDTSSASSAPDDPILSCIGDKGVNSIWFRYTPPAAGMLSINTVGSDFDTAIAVLTGTPGNFTERGCDDNGESNNTSSLNLFVNGGTVYYIEAVGKNAAGNLSFNLDYVSCHSLTTNISPAGSGQINITPAPNCNETLYTKGTSIQLTAVANSGFEFNTWSGGINSASNPLSLDLTANTSIQANFLPNPPLLLLPANEIVVDNLTPTFSWEDYPNASKHQLVISQSSTLTRPIFNSTTGETHQTLIKPLKVNTRYYWSVRSYVNGIWSKWSETRTFVTPNPPLAPKLISPVSGARINNQQPTFDWSDALLPTPAVGYQIQVAKMSSFSTVDVDEIVTESTFTLNNDLDFNQRYYWRVRAYNALNHFGAWSSTFIFFTLPETPMLLTPEDQSLENNLRPLFDWTDATNGARNYTLQIAKDAEFRTLILTASPPTSQYQTVKDLPRLTILYWRVKANDSYGSGAWSSSRRLTTPNPPHIPALLLPIHKSVVPTYRPTLDWSDPPLNLGTYTATEGYQVQIATDSLFTAPVVDQSGLTESVFTPIDDLPAGKYFWRVRAYNAEGAFSNWSTVRFFSTPATILGTVVDALSGSPLENVTVSIAGTTQTTTTAADGSYRLDYVNVGKRQVNAQTEERIPAGQMLVVQAGKEYNLRFVSLPVDPASAYRFVLTWDQTVSTDLDLHLWLPTASPEHIYWGNAGQLNDFPGALLHRDDRDGGGPETVQVNLLQPDGNYLLAVYRRSGEIPWNKARAVVQVYKGNILVATYKAPLSTSTSRWWKVLILNGTTGAITPYNRLTISSGAAYDPATGTFEDKP